METNTIQLNKQNSLSLVLSNPTAYFTRCKNCKKILFLDMVMEHEVTCLDLNSIQKQIQPNNDYLEPEKDTYLELLGLSKSDSFSSPLPISNGVGDNEFKRILHLLTPELNQPWELSRKESNDGSAMAAIASRTRALCSLARCKPFEIRISPFQPFPLSMKVDFKKITKPIICLKNLKTLPVKHKQSNLNSLLKLEVRVELKDIGMKP